MKEKSPNDRLSRRVVKGGAWVFALKIVDKGFGIIRLIILARILSPADFGLMGIALLTMSSLEMFSQTGFQAALIQKKGNVEEYLDSAWTVTIIRGVVLFGILILIAPYASSFLDSPQAKPIIQVVGFSILFLSFSNIGIVYFQKDMEFNKQFIYQLSGTVVDFVVAVSAAFILKSVWALVIGLLAGNFVRFITSYILHAYRPRLSFDFHKAKELFKFGKWILGSSILMFLVNQGGSIFVGKLLGVTMLGFYQMAFKLSNMPTTMIAHVISKVTFPAYSKMQDNIPKLRDAYLKVLQLTAFLSFLIAGLIFALAPDLINVVLGEKWMPMVTALQVLVLSGLVRAIAATTGPVFRATGNPRIDTRWQLIRLFVLAVLIYPLTVKWGISGASIALLFSVFTSMLGFCFMVIKVTKCGVKDFIKILILSLTNMTIMILFVFALKYKMESVGLMNLAILMVSSISVYFGAVFLSDKIFNYKMILLLKDSLVSFRIKFN